LSVFEGTDLGVQGLGRERINARVDLANSLLRRSGGFFFNNRFNIIALGRLADHATIASGVRELCGEQGHRGLFLQVEVAQPGNRFGRDQGSVAGEHDDVLIRGERLPADHDRVACAALLFLQDKIHSRALHGFSDEIGLVADDRVDVLRLDDARRCRDDVCEQGFAADFMKNFGIFGLEACALAGGHDGNCDPGRVRCRHSLSI